MPQRKKRKRKIKRVKKKSYTKGLVFIIGIAAFLSVAFFYVIPRIRAEETTSITKDTDTDFSQGALSNTEISGSGSGAHVQLTGGGGVSWWDHDYTYRRQLSVENNSSSKLRFRIFSEN